MPFKPSVHGWPFSNEFDASASLLGLGAEPEGSFGLAGGLCWAALDRYMAGVGIPPETAPPSAGEPLHNELVRRQVAALRGVWERVRTWQERPDGSWRDRLPLRIGVPLPGPDLASMTRREWSGIRRSLDRGEPVLLTLVLPSDPYVRTRSAEQVLAYGYARAGRRVTVSIYHPSRPQDDEVQLAFWLGGEMDARLTGGREVRGFFAVPAERARSAGLSAETFADRSVIGLNRKVTGLPTSATGWRRLELVARDGDGSLLHFRRRDGRHWEGANVTERAELAGAQLYSDPVALSSPVGLHVFARSYVGDLLHFRLLRRWSRANRTEGKRAGPRFRLAGDPIPVRLGRGRISVVGRGSDGGLVHYLYAPVRGWAAEQVPALGDQAVSGDPAVLAVGGELHLVGISGKGRLIHLTRVDDRWTVVEPADSDGIDGQIRLEGRPVAHLRGDTLHIFARGRDGSLIHVSRTAAGRWDGGVICKGLTADPVVTAGPAGLHVFAATPDAGLIHAWGERTWRTEHLPGSRPGIEPETIPTGDLVAWGDAASLHLVGLREDELMTLAWRADTDWIAAPAALRPGVGEAHRPGETLRLVRDAAGTPHVVTTDGRGTVLHFEPAPWREPEPGSPSRGAPRRATPASYRPRKATRLRVAAGPQPKESGDLEAAIIPGSFEPEASLETEVSFEPPVSSPEPKPARAPKPEPEPAPEAATPSTSAEPELLSWPEEQPAPQGPEVLEPLDLALLDSWPPRPRTGKEKS